MSQFFSRRQFLWGVGVAVVGSALLAQKGEPAALAAQEAAGQLQLTNTERWLLSTGQDDLDPDIYAALAISSSSRVFLPMISN
ncbi:MAG: hypothetical protein OHK0022_27460 [Roseiflexaceae bacterium]